MKQTPDLRKPSAGGLEQEPWYLPLADEGLHDFAERATGWNCQNIGTQRSARAETRRPIGAASAFRPSADGDLDTPSQCGRRCLDLIHSGCVA